MGCILRVAGVDLDADSCLRVCELEPCSIFRKGETYRGRVMQRSGFSVEVSSAGWDDLPQQIEDAIAFLELNQFKLEKLQFPGIEWRILDFPVESRDVASQCDIFPARLLKLAGNIGIDIEISRH